ncbi:MAG: ISAs1 family transposase [Actinomycetes bacterium]
MVAIDGKTARGADARAVHLLAAFDTGTVLGQAVVDGKSNEINAFAPLCDRLDLSGVLVTADALHTQRAHVGYLRERGAHYLLTVKGNQPSLLAQLTALPWTQVPVADVTVNKGHGRLEQRVVKLTAVAVWIGFPDAALAVQITRRRKSLTGRRGQTETVHTIADLGFDQTSPAELADAARAHWGIETRLHWIRDVTFAEDLFQIRTGHGPAVMATLRNLAINLHRTASATTIARACRTVSRHPNRVLPLLG